MKNLREYQIKAISEFENSEHKNIVLQMPTGSGKTFTFCEIAKTFFVVNVKKVLILVHRTELLEQAQRSLGERCFRIEKGIKSIPHDFDYYVGMVETTARRLNLLPEFGLAIIDECHIANFSKMPFFENQNTRVLGVTATPLATKPLANLYDYLISPTNINQLILDGHLLESKVFAFASDLVEKQKFKIKGGEFDEKQMQDFYSSEKMVKNVIESYWKYSAGKKTIIFNVNISHNAAVYESLKIEGLNVFSITSETSKIDREETIKKFAEHSDAILCNVGVLTAGFDEPSIKTVILNRATRSLVLYLQMVGRGARPFENDKDFLILDLGKNTSRFGFYEKQHDWQTYFKHGTKKDKDTVGAMPIKECPKCNFMQHTRKTICESCGHDFEEERDRQQKEEKEQKLVLLIKERPIDIPTEKLFEVAEQRQWKPYAVLHKIADHIVNYQTKHGNIVTNEYCESLGILELEKWCKKYDKKFNKWHKDHITQLIDGKRNFGKQDTTGHISIREQLS
jgi:superfamily II DNA or RNA helicase